MKHQKSATALSFLLVANAIARVVHIVVGVLVVGFLAINAPPVRHKIAATASDLASTELVGKVKVEQLGGVWPWGISGVSFKVLDGDEQPVLAVRDANVRFAVLTILQSLIQGDGLSVVIPRVTVESLRANLLYGKDGTYTIAQAFESVNPPKDEKPSTLSLTVTNVELKKLQVRAETAVGPVKVSATELEASMKMSPQRLRAQLQETTFSVDAASTPIEFGLAAEVDAPREADDPLKQLVAKLELEANAQGAQARLAGKLERGYVHLEGRVDDLEPSVVRALWPQFPLTQTLHARVKANGPLSELQTKLHAKLGAGTLAVDATLDAEEPYAAKATAAARSINLRALSKGAPPSRLNADVSVDLHETGKKMNLDFSAKAGGALQKRPLPNLSATGSFVDGELDVEGQLQDQSTALKFRTSVKEQNPDVYHVSFSARGGETRRALRLKEAQLTIGSLVLRADGTFNVASRSAELSASAKGSALGWQEYQVGTLALRAKAEGPWVNPTFQTRVELDRVQLPPYKLTYIRAKAAGRLKNVQIDAELDGEALPRVQLTTHASQSPLTLSDTLIRLKHNEVEIAVSADKAVLETQDKRVDDLRIAGLGKPVEASVRQRRGRLDLKLKAPRIEFDPILRFVGAKGKGTQPIAGTESARKTLRAVRLGGAFGLITDLRVRGAKAEGEVEMQSHDLRLLGDKASLQLRARVQDGQVNTRARSTWGRSAISLRLSDVRVPRGLLNGEGWKQAHGDGRIRARLLLTELTRVQHLLTPAAEQPSTSYSLGGRLDLEAHVERSAAEEIPDLQFRVRSTKLQVRAVKESEASSDPILQTAGLDVSVAGRLEGKSRNLRVRSKLIDKNGVLAQADARTVLPSPASWQRADAWRSSPFNVNVRLPARDLATWPDDVRPLRVRGTLGAKLSVQGPLADLKGKLRVQGDGLHANLVPYAPHFDVRAKASFAERQLSLRAQAIHQGKERLFASVQTKLPQGGSLDEALPKAVADAHLRLRHFPVHGVVPASSEVQRGWVDADVRLENYRKNASLDIKAALRNAKLGGVSMKEARIRGYLKQGKLYFLLKAKPRGGYAMVQVKGSSAWGDRPVPSVKVARADAKVRKLNLALFQPLLGDNLSELHGLLSAEAHATNLSEPRDARLQAKASLRRGIFLVPALGQRFHDAQFDATLRSNGDFRIANLQARGESGRVLGKARGTFKHMIPQKVSITLTIPDDEELAIRAAGQNYGRASGEVEVAARLNLDSKKKGPSINIYVRRWDQTLSEQNPQSLHSVESDPHVLVGVRGPQGFRELPLSKPEEQAEQSAGLPLELRLRLSDDVRVQRSAQLRLAVAGSLHLLSGEEAQAEGQIRVPRGWVMFLGKKFEVEEAVVTFEPEREVGNPSVVATAIWKAPDGTLVRVQYVGTVQEGELNLSSEPSYSETQILSLLATGSVDPGEGGGGASQTAASVGGGVITEGFNAVLSDVTNLDVSARVGTSDNNQPRPELAVQVTDDVSAELAYNTSLPAPGQNPDRTLLTLDWYFAKRWVLETTFGDQGTSLFDLIWRYRY